MFEESQVHVLGRAVGSCFDLVRVLIEKEGSSILTQVLPVHDPGHRTVGPIQTPMGVNNSGRGLETELSAIFISQTRLEASNGSEIAIPDRTAATGEPSQRESSA